LHHHCIFTPTEQGLPILRLYLAKFLAHPMTKQVAAKAMELIMQFLSKQSPATQALAGAAIGTVNNSVTSLTVDASITPAQAPAPAPVSSQPTSPVSPASPSSACNNQVASAPASPVAPVAPPTVASPAPTASPPVDAKGKVKKEGGLFSLKKKVSYGLHGVEVAWAVC
jgi:hypothetical protein